jgi:hypothetical protein
MIIENSKEKEKSVSQSKEKRSSGSIYHRYTTYHNRKFKRKREVSKSVKRKEKLRDPRCQLGYGSRKPKIHDSRNFLETLELYLGKSDCF